MFILYTWQQSMNTSIPFKNLTASLGDCSLPVQSAACFQWLERILLTGYSIIYLTSNYILNGWVLESILIKTYRDGSRLI